LSTPAVQISSSTPPNSAPCRTCHSLAISRNAPSPPTMAAAKDNPVERDSFKTDTELLVL
jgi:hypothetical protein